MILLEKASQIVTPLSGGKFHVIENGAIVADNGRIVFVGDASEASTQYSAAERIDVSGKVLLPGFVDAHTHAIFGGDRCSEFVMRLQGATYQEIAAAGGGIQSTVQATRAASESELLETTKAHLKQMLQFGTTTVEIKSGYGLDWTTEKKLLKIAKTLQKIAPLDVVITFLGAHDFPREKSRDEYLSDLVMEMLPQVKAEELAEFCDVFCDQGYFTNEQTQIICERAKELGFKIKLHVDELADVNGAALAADLGAISADHLILANDEGIRRMAQAGVIAVLLPGTSFALKCKQHAPARKMIQNGVRIALATDFNPGTCFCHSMQYVLQLACLLYGLTPEEAIIAATLNGAAALDREKQIGSLEIGKQMDCLIFDVPHYGHLFYNLGVNHLATVIKRGKIIWNKK